MNQRHSHRIQRTLQACAACRRRKTKCNGARPRCRHCTTRSIDCVWPDSGENVPAIDELCSAATLDQATSPPRETGLQFPTRRAIRRCWDIFYELHFVGDFCSFMYRLQGEDTVLNSSFLATAMVTLCARYLTPDDAVAEFGLSTGKEVSSSFKQVARRMARDTSDEPTVPHIQANLILALSEFLDNAGSRHWMYAGTAIRMAQIMRLNKEYHQVHSQKEQEVIRRTFWACLLVDKLLAYFLSKPATILSITIGTALPSTDVSIAYQEGTRGLTLDTLASYTGFPSDIGLSPFLIKTVCLWGDMVDLHVCNHRLRNRIPPSDSTGLFYNRHRALVEWVAAIPFGLQWSRDAYENHSSLGLGREFVALHFLIHAAFCVAHQTYLPQLDGSSILLDSLDAAGWSLLHRDATLVSTCVTHALAIGDMLCMLLDTERSRADLQSIWVAASILPVANTYLWMQHANDLEYGSAEMSARAQRYFIQLLEVVRGWVDCWPIAQTWLDTLIKMEALYKRAYLVGDLDELELDASTSPPLGEGGQEKITIETEEEGFRPRPGNGYPSLSGAPDLCSSIRYIASDASVRPNMLHSIWAGFATGWMSDFLSEDTQGSNIPTLQRQ